MSKQRSIQWNHKLTPTNESTGKSMNMNGPLNEQGKEIDQRRNTMKQDRNQHNKEGHQWTNKAVDANKQRINQCNNTRTPRQTKSMCKQHTRTQWKQKGNWWNKEITSSIEIKKTSMKQPRSTNEQEITINDQALEIDGEGKNTNNTHTGKSISKQRANNASKKENQWHNKATPMKKRRTSVSKPKSTVEQAKGHQCSSKGKSMHTHTRQSMKQHRTSINKQEHQWTNNGTSINKQRTLCGKGKGHQWANIGTSMSTQRESTNKRNATHEQTKEHLRRNKRTPTSKHSTVNDKTNQIPKTKQKHSRLNKWPSMNRHCKSINTKSKINGDKKEINEQAKEHLWQSKGNQWKGEGTPMKKSRGPMDMARPTPWRPVCPNGVPPHKDVPSLSLALPPHSHPGWSLVNSPLLGCSVVLWV